VAEFSGEGWPERDADEGDDADGEVDAGAALFGPVHVLEVEQ